jgi:hypothetical protein
MAEFMQEWIIELRGHKFDLQNLGDWFSSSLIRVTREHNSYYLWSSKFTHLIEAEEVRQCALTLLQRMNALAKIHSGEFKNVELGNVLRRGNDGKPPHQYIFLETIKSQARVFGGAPPISVDWLELAEQDPNIAEALKNFSFREHNWVNLYKIYEIIEADFGGMNQLFEQTWVNESKIRAFKYTANHPAAEAGGSEARHARSSQMPPKKPMRLPEAIALIKDLLQSWLSAKSDNCP